MTRAHTTARSRESRLAAAAAGPDRGRFPAAAPPRGRASAAGRAHGPRTARPTVPAPALRRATATCVPSAVRLAAAGHAHGPAAARPTAPALAPSPGSGGRPTLQQPRLPQRAGSTRSAAAWDVPGPAGRRGPTRRPAATWGALSAPLRRARLPGFPRRLGMHSGVPAGVREGGPGALSPLHRLPAPAGVPWSALRRSGRRPRGDAGHASRSHGRLRRAASEASGGAGPTRRPRCVDPRVQHASRLPPATRAHTPARRPTAQRPAAPSTRPAFHLRPGPGTPARSPRRRHGARSASLHRTHCPAPVGGPDPLPTTPEASGGVGALAASTREPGTLPGSRAAQTGCHPPRKPRYESALPGSRGAAQPTAAPASGCANPAVETSSTRGRSAPRWSLQEIRGMSAPGPPRDRPVRCGGRRPRVCASEPAADKARGGRARAF